MQMQAASDLLLSSLAGPGAEPSVSGACSSSSSSMGVLVIRDTLQTSAAFMVHTLLRRALQAGEKVRGTGAAATAVSPAAAAACRGQQHQPACPIVNLSNSITTLLGMMQGYG